MRALLSDTVHIPVTIADVPAHGQRLVTRVLPEGCVSPAGTEGTDPAPAGPATTRA